MAITATFNSMTLAVKSKLIQDLAQTFKDHPVFSELRVQNKYAFDDRVAYGIVVRNVTVEPLQLAPDNWMGNMRSHVSLARIQGAPGTSVEWVTEDTANLYEQHDSEDVTASVVGQTVQVAHPPIRKPSGPHVPPRFQGVLVRMGTRHVEPMHIDYERGILEFPVGTDMAGPIKVTYQEQKLSPAGFYVVEMVDDKSYDVTTIHGKEFTYRPGFGVEFLLPDTVGGTVTVKVDGTSVDSTYYDYCPYRKRVTWFRRPVDGVLTVEDEFGPVTWDYTKGERWRLGDFVWNQERAYKLPYAPEALSLLESPPVSYRVVEDRLYLSESLPSSTEVALQRKVTPTASPLTAEVFDAVSKFSLLTNIWQGSVRVFINRSVVPASDFSVNLSTGEFQLRRLLLDQDELRVSYSRIVGKSDAPFTIPANFHTESKAIPGVLLHFGAAYQSGDQQIVIVTAEREMTAKVYGGKWRQTFNLDIYAQDTINQEYLADMTAANIWFKLKPVWDAEGWTIERIAPGGEAEEPWDEASGEMQFTASLQVTVLSDWEVREPIPVVTTAIELGDKVIYQDGGLPWMEFLSPEYNRLPFNEVNNERWS